MTKKLLLLLFCLGSLFDCLSQDFSGKIVNDQDQPLENVTVYNLRNAQHTHTDMSGTFVLKGVSVKDSVYFSILGYKAKSQTITDSIIGKRQRIVLESENISLSQILITSKIDLLSSILEVDIKTNPVASSQQILRKVPGLIIGQHAGGGKAEQIFLRGFDVDHGTDVSLSVDGMPVNMVSHAHGQGYADLHFVIPETIESVEFGKGPFYYDKGNFNTAGYVNLGLKSTIDKSKISIEAGQFNTIRMVGLIDLINGSNTDAYLASELYLSDGPFESPQDFKRLNLMGKLNHYFNDSDYLNLTLSHFQSRWDASGQIPQRAVDQNLISRFGAIDDTEGGETHRSNILISSYNQLGKDQKLQSKAFLSTYNFELFSNFTFFLNDSINGDQIRQTENRMLAGVESVYSHNDVFNSSNIDFNSGIGFRYDHINDIGLSRTLNRKTILNRLSYGDVNEINQYGFLNFDIKVNRWKFNPALRLDHFNFQYNNRLSETYDKKSDSKIILSPKFNTVYSFSKNLQLFLKTGIGFHSNDTRVVIENEGRQILPKAYGADIGTIFKPNPNLVLNTTIWSLFLEQEFVYVGDEGIVEPSGKTKRYGIEIGARYQMLDWLYLYSDINYAHARSSEEAEGNDYIPLAPDITSAGGITIDNLGNFSANISYRYIDDRPANEDNSINAEGYFITDANINYSYNNWQFGLIIENLFDSKWKETQFATESRLFDEDRSTEEIHFTPGTPFYLRARLAVSF